MPPQFSLPNDTSLCPGDSMQLSVSSGSNIVWNTGSTSPSIWASNAGVYWAEAYNVPGCAKRDSVVVSNLSLISPFSIGPDTTYCGSFNRVLVTGNPNTVWSTGATAAQISIATPGTYWATQSNACNSIADTIVVSQTAIPVISLVADTGFCQGDSVLLSAGGAANILWSTGATSNSIYASTPGIYWVEGFNAPQCVIRDSVNVAQLTLPVFSLGADTSFCSSGGLTLDPAIAGVQYHWQDNSALQQFTATQSGTYSVTVTNACGSATDEINVDFRAGGCQLAIPTAFSPNGDGVNDLFKAVAFCPVAKFSMHVYNRWGELVYATDDVTEGWDGVFRRESQPLGVFVYYIEYFNDCSQKMEKVVGNVTLMR